MVTGYRWKTCNKHAEVSLCLIEMPLAVCAVYTMQGISRLHREWRISWALAPGSIVSLGNLRSYIKPVLLYTTATPEAALVLDFLGQDKECLASTYGQLKCAETLPHVNHLGQPPGLVSSLHLRIEKGELPSSLIYTKRVGTLSRL